jgi:bifunctional DNA-binding transcriptional regulator/antitoxin component of YhaV-PrlF toxin-antitoxin module
MLYPIRITHNDKGGFRFGFPKEVREECLWKPGDRFIAYPGSPTNLIIHHFSDFNDNSHVYPLEKYKQMVYVLYVVKDREQLTTEVPTKLCRFFKWEKQRLLVLKYTGTEYVTIRSIIKL